MTDRVHSSPCDGWCLKYERTDVEKQCHHDYDGHEICRHHDTPKCPHKEWLAKWLNQNKKEDKS